MADYRVIGTPGERVDGPEMLSGVLAEQGECVAMREVAIVT